MSIPLFSSRCSECSPTTIASSTTIPRALGIVVDDAIVVGEHSEHLEENRGMDTSNSSILAATRMSPPVISAMLTTVAAFLPLFFIKGIIGQVIFAIPAGIANIT